MERELIAAVREEPEQKEQLEEERPSQAAVELKVQEFEETTEEENTPFLSMKNEITEKIDQLREERQSIPSWGMKRLVNALKTASVTAQATKFVGLYIAPMIAFILFFENSEFVVLFLGIGSVVVQFYIMITMGLINVRSRRENCLLGIEKNVESVNEKYFNHLKELSSVRRPVFVAFVTAISADTLIVCVHVLL